MSVSYTHLAGELTVQDTGTEAVLKAGDAVFTADGGVHSAENRTGQEAQMPAVIFPRYHLCHRRFESCLGRPKNRQIDSSSGKYTQTDDRLSPAGNILFFLPDK